MEWDLNLVSVLKDRNSVILMKPRNLETDNDSLLSHKRNHLNTCLSSEVIGRESRRWLM